LDRARAELNSAIAHVEQLDPPKKGGDSGEGEGREEVTDDAKV
jgi:hypothetical protein